MGTVITSSLLAQPVPCITRRKAIGGLTRVVTSTAIMAGFPALNLRAQTGFNPGDASMGAPGFWEVPRWVWLKRAATGEQIKVVYWQDGQLIEDAYRQICWFLRDVRFERMLAAGAPQIRLALDRNQIGSEHLSAWLLMDPVLIDILYAYTSWLATFGVNSPITLTSGFRHLITNSMTEGAARNSWHMQGGAADIVVPGVTPAALAKFGAWLAGGGVGVYQSRGFVHLDRGRVRTFKG